MAGELRTLYRQTDTGPAGVSGGASPEAQETAPRVCPPLSTERDSKMWGEEALHKKSIKEATKIRFPKIEHAQGYRDIFHS